MSEVVNLKIPKEITEQYRREFGLGQNFTNKDVVLYGLCAGLPKVVQDAYVRDYRLDKDVMKRLTDIQSQVNSDAVFGEIQAIKNALLRISKQTQKNDELYTFAESSDLMLRLLIPSAVRHPVDKNTLREQFERDRSKELDASIESIRKDGSFKRGDI